jgi:hypothetical protein
MKGVRRRKGLDWKFRGAQRARERGGIEVDLPQICTAWETEADGLN